MKGYRRNMIVLRGTGSDDFDAAYFIVRDGSEEKSEKSLVDEARRIVSEGKRDVGEKPKYRKMPTVMIGLAAFIAGVILGILLF